MALVNKDRVKTAVQRQRAYQARHPERVAAYQKMYVERNKEKLTGKRLEWRKRNQERDAETRRRYEKSGKRPKRDRTDYFRLRYEQNKNRVKAIGQASHMAHPEKGRARRARRRALMSGASTVPFTPQQLRERLSMFGHKCWMCGAPEDETDHVIPLSRGGPHALANLRPACLPCNRRKGAKKWLFEHSTE